MSPDMTKWISQKVATGSFWSLILYLCSFSIKRVNQIRIPLYQNVFLILFCNAKLCIAVIIKGNALDVYGSRAYFSGLSLRDGGLLDGVAGDTFCIHIRTQHPCKQRPFCTRAQGQNGLLIQQVVWCHPMERAGCQSTLLVVCKVSDRSAGMLAQSKSSPLEAMTFLYQSKLSLR